MRTNLDIFKDWKKVLKSEISDLSKAELSVVSSKAGISQSTLRSWLRESCPSILNYVAFMQALNDYKQRRVVL